MKRIVVVFAVAALMAAMMVGMAMPAFAQGVTCTNVTSSTSPLNGLQSDNVNACGRDIGIASPF